MSIEDAAKQEWDLVALPGGMPGTSNIGIPLLNLGALLRLDDDCNKI